MSHCKKHFNSELAIIDLGCQSITGKGNYIRALRQKNEGFVEVKRRPIKMDGRTIHKTLSPKGHIFKLGLRGDPTCERYLGENNHPHTHPMLL
jgi:hypothetical protein